MEWQLTITRAENGYVCEYAEEVEDDKYHNVTHVIEENDLDDLEAMEVLMYYVSEHFGVYRSKHNQSLEIVRRNPDGTIEDAFADDLQNNEG